VNAPRAVGSAAGHVEPVLLDRPQYRAGGVAHGLPPAIVQHHFVVSSGNRCSASPAACPQATGSTASADDPEPATHHDRRLAAGTVGFMSKSALPWWLKYVNKAMIGLQKLGVLGEQGPVVLEVRGRRTGRLRRTPVTPMVVDGRRYVVGGIPGSDWAANVRAAGEATLHVGRRAERVRMVELPSDAARPLLRQFPQKVPTGVEFIKRAGLVSGPHPDEFEALAGRCPVFRIDTVSA